MEKNVLVIVESPTKARTIKNFLPPNFRVEASVGHIRDLPQTAAEIPAAFKSKEWSRLGIDVENDFSPLYVIPKEKSVLVRQLKAFVADSEVLYLATDEDREGESISWHLMDVLSPKIPVKRMVFHEITQKAIQEALEHTRDVDMALVNAQETRRILDRLYGYTLSPLIWKKIAYGLSAGRVQSPGLRLIVERELARCRFKSANYWDLKVELEKTGSNSKEHFPAKLIEVDGKKIAQSKDFDPETGELANKSHAVLLSQAQAQELQKKLSGAAWKITDLTKKDTVQTPSPPFITSTLQQEANRKLGLSTRDAMRVAQKLYEEGFITYMRTDSPSLSDEALKASRDAVLQLFGESYLPASPRHYAAKSKGAQESHEAIRPSAPFRTPDETGLAGREKNLYELIWKRTLASQMAEARKANVQIRIEAGNAVFSASGVKILFPGFLRAYVEGRDDPEAALDNFETYLPDLSVGEILNPASLELDEHFTKPPARFSEAALVQRLEKEGIGRPSTYATIIATLQERGYVFKKETTLVPTITGIAVVQLLTRNFPQLIDYNFTSEMEKHLDEIAAGKDDRLAYLKAFYSGEQGLAQVVTSTELSIDADASRTVALPQLRPDQAVKIGRFGPYIVRWDSEGKKANASLPPELPPADLLPDELDELLQRASSAPEPLGMDPATGKPIFALLGRFGPHLQLGLKTDEEKPRTVGLPKGMNLKDVTLEVALQLLSLPRTLGEHPRTGKPITANNGRYGPYVAMDGEFRSLKKSDDVFTIDLARAVELFDEEKKVRPGLKVLQSFAAGTAGMKSKVQVLEGKFGAYLKVGMRNISLPDAYKTPEAATKLTAEVLAEFLNTKTPAKKKATSKAPAKKKAAGKAPKAQAK
jgi:DNA topoisomerase-1